MTKTITYKTEGVVTHKVTDGSTMLRAWSFDGETYQRLDVEDIPDSRDIDFDCESYEDCSWKDFNVEVTRILDGYGVTDPAHRAALRHEAQSGWRWTRYNNGEYAKDPDSLEKTFWVKEVRT